MSVREVPVQIQNEARAFRVWREGASVDWECTAAELAEATRLPETQVRSLCRRRGWPIQKELRKSRRKPRYASDADAPLSGSIRFPKEREVQAADDPVRGLLDLVHEIEKEKDVEPELEISAADD